ncbi:MAG TPA: mannose-1-phosphate guanylyltransferase [Phnomibacter sp.]|nr:mannose-1-phosphate guanylyltransferase [Phnomibacter sp.]
MAGGIGSRFWPLSRAKMPKQFLDILNTGQSLLQSTFNRFAEFIPTQNIFVITSDEYTHLVEQHLPKLDPANILSEPSRKNTAPCIAYMAFKLAKRDPKATFIVAPADHLILDARAFEEVCQRAFSFVEENPCLLTLGIQPTYPNTGYGYIQYNHDEVGDGIFKVKTFTEKPNLELAKTFLASGDFLWNSGMFIWKVEDIIAAFERYMPEMFDVFASEADRIDTVEERSALASIYPQCSNISIDYGIMEKASNVKIIPASFGWSDLGTWGAAYENMEKDYLGNAVNGNNVVVIDATRNMVHAPSDKLVLLQGLDDFVVVDTQDVLVICQKEKEQELKDYLAEIRRNKGDKFL